MKNVVLFLLLFVTIAAAQPLNSGINFNSTYTPLGNGATWTGTAEQLHNNFSFACVTVYSNKSGTLKVSQSRDGVKWRSYYKFSYTALDTLGNKFWVPIQLPWIRVSYTNASAGAQGTFELTTSYMLSSAIGTDSTGHITFSGSIPGVSTYAAQLLLLHIDSLIQSNTKKLTDSLAIQRAILNKMTSNPTTSIRQDTLLAWLKLAGRTSGSPYFSSITNLSTSNSYAQIFTTTGTTIDSVSFNFTPHKITIINDGVVTDSLFISSSKTFPTTNKVLRLGGEGLTKDWAFTKLYFKVGTTPLPSKKIRIEGN